MFEAEISLKLRNSRLKFLKISYKNTGVYYNTRNLDQGDNVISKAFFLLYYRHEETIHTWKRHIADIWGLPIFYIGAKSNPPLLQKLLQAAADLCKKYPVMLCCQELKCRL